MFGSTVDLTLGFFLFTYRLLEWKGNAGRRSIMPWVSKPTTETMRSNRSANSGDKDLEELRLQPLRAASLVDILPSLSEMKESQVCQPRVESIGCYVLTGVAG